MNKKVSVIMGIYNCKDFNLLEKSIDSILKQTYKNFEFIICNDGSTNGTLDFLNKIKSKDKRIKILSYDKNKGLNYALNKCLEQVTGEYVARQDDDDISNENRLKKQVEFLDNNQEYDIVGTNADIFDNNGVWGEYIVPEKPTKKDFFWNSPFMHPTIMIRKKAYDLVHGYRTIKITRRCEDIDLFMRMYAEGLKGYNIQEKLYLYKLVNDPKKKHRPMKYRIDESIVKFEGYKKMGVLLQGIPFVIKPILVGIIPSNILSLIKKKEYKVKIDK